MKTLYGLVNGIDLFGKTFNLNFHKKWDRYKTVPGAAMTLAMYGFVLFYIYILFAAMTGRQRNIINSLSIETSI